MAFWCLFAAMHLSSTYSEEETDVSTSLRQDA